jgi:hypothetical protein
MVVLQDRTDLSSLPKEISMKTKIRQEFPEDLEQAIEWYGLDYVTEIYKATMQEICE